MHGGFSQERLSPYVLASAVNLPRTALIIKRLEDMVIGGLLVIGLSPVLLLLALLIRLNSPGPAIFRQERRGLHLKPFMCFKFRTMYVDQTDHDCHEQTSHGDPRVTRMGRFLRHHSLDELPQLFNVVIGHMSLCGPRPHARGTSVNGLPLEEVNAQYLSRYSVKPGITGWAQVNGWRGILDTEEKLAKRVEYDLHYIANWSVLLDMKILFMTIFCLFDDEGAY